MVKPASTLTVHSTVKNLATDWSKNLTLPQEILNIWFILYDTKKSPLNLCPWILKKNPKCGTVTERVSRGKIQSAALHHLYMFLCFGIFSGKRARWRSQKMTYIFVHRGIFPHILAYAIWNWHYEIAQLTLYLHILFSFSKFPLWRHQRLFWIFFQKIRSVMVQKITDKG